MVFVCASQLEDFDEKWKCRQRLVVSFAWEQECKNLSTAGMKDYVFCKFCDHEKGALFCYIG